LPHIRYGFVARQRCGAWASFARWGLPDAYIAADVIKVAETIETLTSGFGLLKESVELATTASIKLALTKAGRAGKQQRLKELADDDKVSSADRGWINQEMNQIERGKSGKAP
jgi:hypothetical protein